MAATGTSGGVPADTRQRILEAAAGLFAAKGYGDTTTRELSDAVGVQKASLYHHYGSKEEILYEICEVALYDIHRAVVEARDLALDDELGCVHVLSQMIRAHVEHALGSPQMHATMLVELRRLGDDRLVEVRAARRRYEQLFAEQVAAAQEDGLLRTDFSGRLLTLGLLNLLNWTIFWYSAEGTTTPAELGSMFAGIFLEGAVSRTVGAIPDLPAVTSYTEGRVT